MKVFVTGGTGFIGSHFLNQCHHAGHEILALRRSPVSIPRISLTKNPRWLTKEMGEVDHEDLAGCTTLVHLAAHSANVPYDSLEKCIQHNVLEPLALFRVAIQAGIKRFIVAGTCFEYGTAGERYDFIPVNAPLEPTASYPVSKAAASLAFRVLALEENIEMIQLRIFQVYGEGEPEKRFWPSLRKKALSGENMEMSAGLQIRDFVRVQDVATEFLRAVDRKDLTPGDTLFENVASGNPRSLADFAREQWKSFNAAGDLILGAVPMRPEEVMRYVPKLPA